MTKETENPTGKYQALHLHMIGTVEACLYHLRDMLTNTQGLRINANNYALGEMQIERNKLVALLGELNASMKRMAMLDEKSMSEANVLRAISKLRERVHQAKESIFKTHFDMGEPWAQAS